MSFVSLLEQVLCLSCDKWLSNWPLFTSKIMVEITQRNTAGNCKLNTAPFSVGWWRKLDSDEAIGKFFTLASKVYENCLETFSTSSSLPRVVHLAAIGLTSRNPETLQAIASFLVKLTASIASPTSEQLRQVSRFTDLEPTINETTNRVWTETLGCCLLEM